ncbi:MAG TPA: hypothetical protein VF631_09060 [Allosphingosinicella sp.]|jgi:ElaB/YqjD/DUF883 family membrane-anchored ribosome-binding protein|uniref:hypothetical protein n=1 Tax=Allosphingosinicella sp. TaxID=2823234 RepID=UPI002F27B57C
MTKTDGKQTNGTGTAEAGTGDSGRLSAVTGKVRTSASDAYSSAREKTSAAYGTAREKAARASQATAQGVESYPVVAIAGGLAVGALLAAVLPRTQREQEVIGPYGQKLTDAAREAAHSAAEAGREQANQIPAKAMQKIGEAVVEAVTTSGNAQ